MEQIYRLKGVTRVAVSECIDRWDVHGYPDKGIAIEWCNFRKDRESAARALACEWCKVLGMATYTFTAFMSERYGFHEAIVDVETGSVLSEREYTL